MVYMRFIGVELASQLFVRNDNLCVVQASHIERLREGGHCNNVIRIGPIAYRQGRCKGRWSRNQVLMDFITYNEHMVPLADSE